MSLQEKVNALNKKAESLGTIECIKLITDEGKTIFTTSFGYEDQVISDIIFSNSLPVDVITLDTGRLLKRPTRFFIRHCKNTIII